MAKNECWSKGGGYELLMEEVKTDHPGTLDSGEAFRASEFTGVALVDIADAGSGTITRAMGFGLTVAATDDGGASAVALGDPLYYHSDDGAVNKVVNDGYFIGWAWGVVASGSAVICVLLDQDPDYTRFMDEQLLEFGDGAGTKEDAGDVQIWFDLADQDFMVSNLLAGSDVRIDTTDDGRIELNSHTYGATIPNWEGIVRVNPTFGTANPALDVCTFNVQPLVLDTVTGTNIIGSQSDIYINGGVGDWSGVMRAGQFQVTDDAVAGRTIAGPVMMIRTWQQLIATVTNGVYAIYSDIATGGTGYTAWLWVGDDGGQQADLASAVSATVIAVVTCEVDGAAVGYIPVYDGYTPA